MFHLALWDPELMARWEQLNLWVWWVWGIHIYTLAFLCRVLSNILQSCFYDLPITFSALMLSYQAATLNDKKLSATLLNAVVRASWLKTITLRLCALFRYSKVLIIDCASVLKMIYFFALLILCYEEIQNVNIQEKAGNVCNAWDMTEKKHSKLTLTEHNLWHCSKFKPLTLNIHE